MQSAGEWVKDTKEDAAASSLTFGEKQDYNSASSSDELHTPGNKMCQAFQSLGRGRGVGRRKMGGMGAGEGGGGDSCRLEVQGLTHEAGSKRSSTQYCSCIMCAVLACFVVSVCCESHFSRCRIILEHSLH